MTTIHLTDAQRDTFAACGLIVIDGEPSVRYGQPGDNFYCASAVVAPEGWRILTKPCDTCNGFGAKYWTDYPSGATVSSCGVCGWDVEMRQNRWEHVEPDRYRLAHEGRDRPFKLDHTTYPQPCPDCVGGRQVVTLTATCPRCDGRGVSKHGPRCADVCDFGVVTLGRFTIPALLPVVDSRLSPDQCPRSDYIEVDPHGCHFVEFEAPGQWHWRETLNLERLTELEWIACADGLQIISDGPRPGQFIARPERVA